jgi:predicted DCC family thiol-disulfide oxidoreductase YuxK
VTANDSNRPVLFFDGECNLCNGLVQFIISHDKKKSFLFAPLQSAKGREALAHITGSVGAGPDSLILFYRGNYFTKSAAALRVAKLLGGIWQLLYAGIILPRFLRDAVYDLVSRNRYKWFGKRDGCMIPTPELKERFLY